MVIYKPGGIMYYYMDLLFEALQLQTIYKHYVFYAYNVHNLQIVWY